MILRSRAVRWLRLGAWGALALAGCASLRGATAREARLEAELAPYRFATSCDELWPSLLRMLASKGFPLGGRDRQSIGEPEPGVFAQALADGFSTHRTDDGGLAMATDWNRQLGTRYRATGTPAGPDGCRVTFTRIAGGVVSPGGEDLGPDWEMALELVKLLDPGVAARIEAGAP